MVDGILDELKARQPDRLIRQMIGPARVANRQSRHPEVFERFHPRLEDRRDRLVPLQVNAANRPGPVIDVEVAGELGMLRLQLHRRRIAVVRPDVFFRAEQSLLFASPQPDADRTPQLHTAHLEETHRFHHDRRTGCVVGSARAGVPRVEVRADHHYLIGLVATRQLADDVEGGLVRVVEPVVDVDLQRDRDFLLERPREASVVLDREDDLRG